ncbi:hypothetical protein AC578_9909 [Pseudocercospora eumusae]|uniref:Uncharacterized protein n=1 Tax=Pseudocercospora eumusae TaxID=321146 RepID=A0A139HB90_9PEZI|nr:hypothetical protein AC578_9909 [Pseudocercospora eumusae]
MTSSASVLLCTGSMVSEAQQQYDTTCLTAMRWISSFGLLTTTLGSDRRYIKLERGVDEEPDSARERFLQRAHAKLHAGERCIWATFAITLLIVILWQAWSMEDSFPGTSNSSRSSYEKGFATDLSPAVVAVRLMERVFTAGVVRNEDGSLRLNASDGTFYAGEPSDALDQLWHDRYRGGI